MPLSTLEMQKKATQSLHMPGERIMKVAEELYQSGFISYPRTETDSFPPGMDLMVSQALAALLLRPAPLSGNLPSIEKSAYPDVARLGIEVLSAWAPHSYNPVVCQQC